MRTLLTFVLAASLPLAASADTQCVPSRMLVVLDHSSSMNDSLGGQSKWSAAVTAVSGIAAGYESKLELGLNVFPNPNQCAPGTTVVSPALGNGAAIAGALPAAPPKSGNYTPMSQTIDVAAADPALADATHRPAILLITDGWQWCSPYDPATRGWPIDAVNNAAAMGIKVFVVGFGAAVDVETLNKMAVAGGTAPAGCDPTGTLSSSPNKCYYQADSPAQLNAALDAVSVTVSAEVCDGVDNDCDGQIDEGLTRPCANACGGGTETCVAGVWTGCSAPAPQAEVCDGVDNDCDGTADEGCTCVAGQSRKCGMTKGACQQGTQTCSAAGQWGECQGSVSPMPETCNGIDDDCDGDVHNGPPAALCPMGGVCDNGTCVINTPSNPATPPSEDGNNKDGCGCDVGGRTRSLPVGSMVAVLLLVGFVARRRHAR